MAACMTAAAYPEISISALVWLSNDWQQRRGSSMYDGCRSISGGGMHVADEPPDGGGQARVGIDVGGHRSRVYCT